MQSENYWKETEAMNCIIKEMEKEIAYLNCDRTPCRTISILLGAGFTEEEISIFLAKYGKCDYEIFFNVLKEINNLD
jgi:hypothetical protein